AAPAAAPHRAADPAANPFRFGGEYTNTENGTDYSPARLYHRATGRFTTRDPHPTPLNKYQAFNTNPAEYTDPTGNLPFRLAKHKKSQQRAKNTAARESAYTQNSAAAGLQARLATRLARWQADSLAEQAGREADLQARFAKWQATSGAEVEAAAASKALSVQSREITREIEQITRDGITTEAYRIPKLYQKYEEIASTAYHFHIPLTQGAAESVIGQIDLTKKWNEYKKQLDDWGYQSMQNRTPISSAIPLASKWIADFNATFAIQHQYSIYMSQLTRSVQTAMQEGVKSFRSETEWNQFQRKRVNMDKFLGLIPSL
uniref:RHS repeat-associated core domain-containing protein n=1 Tax=Streptomyces sp. NRRL F-2664 TaxID=1463842 RepID=UPI00131E6D40